jgi:hypothetical protein
MKADRIDALLKELGEIPRPRLPGNFNQRVWREVRLRQAAGGERHSWLPELLAFFLRPSPIAASLLVALAVGVAGNTASVFASRPEKAAAALSLGVFDPRAQNLTLILQN